MSDAQPGRPGTRRCLTVDEMAAKGWRLTAAGFWSTGQPPAFLRAEAEGGAVLPALGD